MEQAVTQHVEANPLAANISVQIQTSLVAPTEIAYHFRKDKELAKEVGDKAKRPTFKVMLPLLTKAGLIAALQAGDKSTELALEKANEAIIDRFRGLINEKVENDKFNKETGKFETELSVGMFNMEDCSFLKIANMPKSERGSGIPKEAFAEFVTDYKETLQKAEAIALFPDKTARKPEVLDKHGVILAGKFNAVRSRKDVIQQMLGFLDVWAAVSPNVEDHQTVYEFLRTKAAGLMEAENFDNL